MHTKLDLDQRTIYLVSCLNNSLTKEEKQKLGYKLANALEKGTSTTRLVNLLDAHMRDKDSVIENTSIMWAMLALTRALEWTNRTTHYGLDYHLKDVLKVESNLINLCNDPLFQLFAAKETLTFKEAKVLLESTNK